MSDDSPDPIELSRSMIRDAWLAVGLLRSGREAMDEIGPAMMRYGHVGSLLISQHHAWYLGGLRRLVDHDSRTSSLRRGLQLVRENVDRIDEQWVCDRGLGHGLDDAWTLEGHAYERRALLRETVETAGGVYEGRLTVDPVDLDIELLTVAGAAVSHFVSKHIAHTDLDRATVTLDYPNDTAGLVDAIMDLTFRWRRLLDAAHSSERVPRIGGSGKMRRALQLHDDDAYWAAVSAADHAVGPDQTPDVYRRHKERVRPTYRLADEGE